MQPQQRAVNLDCKSNIQESGQAATSDCKLGQAGCKLGQAGLRSADCESGQARLRMANRDRRDVRLHAWP